MSSVSSWNEDDVVSWLVNLNPSFSLYAVFFKNNNITGRHLLSLNDAQLVSLQVNSFGHRMDILDGIKLLSNGNTSLKPQPSTTSSFPEQSSTILIAAAVNSIKNDDINALIPAIGEIAKYCKILLAKIDPEDRQTLTSQLTLTVTRGKACSQNRDLDSKRALLLVLKDLQKCINDLENPRAEIPAEDLLIYEPNHEFESMIIQNLTLLVTFAELVKDHKDEEIMGNVKPLALGIKNLCKQTYSNGTNCVETEMAAALVECLNSIITKVRAKPMPYMEIANEMTATSRQVKHCVKTYSHRIKKGMDCHLCKKCVDEEFLFCMGRFGCKRLFHRECLHMSSLSFECVTWNCSLKSCLAKEKHREETQRLKKEAYSKLMKERKADEERMLREKKEAEEKTKADKEKNEILNTRANEIGFKEASIELAIKEYEEEQLRRKNKKRLTNAEVLEMYGDDEIVCRASMDYDLDGATEEDLQFIEGDVIKLIRRIDVDTFYGECEGRVGKFPSAWVKQFDPTKPDDCDDDNEIIETVGSSQVLEEVVEKQPPSSHSTENNEIKRRASLGADRRFSAIANLSSSDDEYDDKNKSTNVKSKMKQARQLTKKASMTTGKKLGTGSAKLKKNLLEKQKSTKAPVKKSLSISSPMDVDPHMQNRVSGYSDIRPVRNQSISFGEDVVAPEPATVTTATTPRRKLSEPTVASTDVPEGNLINFDGSDSACSSPIFSEGDFERAFEIATQSGERKPRSSSLTEQHNLFIKAPPVANDSERRPSFTQIRATPPVRTNSISKTSPRLPAAAFNESSPVRRAPAPPPATASSTVPITPSTPATPITPMNHIQPQQQQQQHQQPSRPAPMHNNQRQQTPPNYTNAFANNNNNNNNNLDERSNQTNPLSNLNQGQQPPSNYQNSPPSTATLVSIHPNQRTTPMTTTPTTPSVAATTATSPNRLPPRPSQSPSQTPVRSPGPTRKAPPPMARRPERLA